jgi:organic radical activating enzyme
MKIAQISTGFIEVQNLISLNIYVVGCSLKCPGCQNQQLQDKNSGVTLKEKQILDLCKNKSMFDCICWLGGEPLEQFDEVLQCNELFANELKKPIIIYTGYTLDEATDKIEKLVSNKYVKLIKCGRWDGKKLGSPESTQKFYSVQNGIISETNSPTI